MADIAKNIIYSQNELLTGAGITDAAQNYILVCKPQVNPVLFSVQIKNSAAVTVKIYQKLKNVADSVLAWDQADATEHTYTATGSGSKLINILGTAAEAFKIEVTGNAGTVHIAYGAKQ